MCMFASPRIPDPVIPPEPQQAKAPDGGVVRSSVDRRVTDRQRGAADTILTSGSGVSTAAPTDKKTLLGQ